LVAIVGCNSHYHFFVDRSWHDEAVVVVGMLAYQIDPAGGIGKKGFFFKDFPEKLLDMCGDHSVLNLNCVLESKISPGIKTTLGKSGLLMESGKCCVSRQIAALFPGRMPCFPVKEASI
jgi:hypothetical protein